MKRFCALWLLFFTLAVAKWRLFAPVFSQHFNVPLVSTVTAAIAAALLLRFVPRLRDHRFAGPGQAMRGRGVEPIATAVVVTTTVLTLFTMMNFANIRGFEIARGLTALIAAITFATAAGRRIRGAALAAALFAIVTIATGWTPSLAAQLLPTEPLAIRWLVALAAATIVIGVVLWRCVEQLRDSAPDAAALLDWAMLPGTFAAIVVASSLLAHPAVTPPAILVANVFGFFALGMTALAGVAAMYHHAFPATVR